jgi:hypothetical protein
VIPIVFAAAPAWREERIRIRPGDAQGGNKHPRRPQIEAASNYHGSATGPFSRPAVATERERDATNTGPP